MEQKVVTPRYDAIYIVAEGNWYVLGHDLPPWNGPDHNFVGMFDGKLKWHQDHGRPKVPLEDVKLVQEAIEDYLKRIEEEELIVPFHKDAIAVQLYRKAGYRVERLSEEHVGVYFPGLTGPPTLGYNDKTTPAEHSPSAGSTEPADNSISSRVRHGSVPELRREVSRARRRREELSRRLLED